MLSRRIRHTREVLEDKLLNAQSVDAPSTNKGNEPFSKNISTYLESINELENGTNFILYAPAAYMFDNNLETKDVKEVFKTLRSTQPLAGKELDMYRELTDELVFEQICKRYELDKQKVQRRIGEETIHSPMEMVADMNNHLDKTSFVYRVMYSDITEAYPLFFDELAVNFEHFNISWPDVDLPSYGGDIWLYLVMFGKRKFDRVLYDPNLGVMSKSKPVIIDMFMAVAADALYALAICQALNGNNKLPKSRTIKVSPENEYITRLDRIKSRLAQIVKHINVKRTNAERNVKRDDVERESVEHETLNDKYLNLW